MAAAVAAVPLYGIWVIADAAYRSGAEPGYDSDARIRLGVILVGAAAVGAFLLTAGAYYLTHIADLRVRRHVRTTIADHLSLLPLGWFDSDAAGRSLKAMSEDVEALHTAVAHGRMELIGSVVTPAAAWVWLCTVDWRLALIILLPTGIHHLFQQQIYVRARVFLAEQGAAIKDLTTAANEELRDAVTLRITSRSLPTSSRLLSASARLHRVVVDSHAEQESRGSKLAALIDPAFTLLVVLVFGMVLLRGTATPPTDLIPFVVAAVLITLAPSTITLSRWGIVAAAAASQRIDALLAEPVQEVASDPRAPSDDNVELSGVSFGYGETPTIRDVNLRLPAGSFTAVVGPSGSGKSTLAALIGRHHDVSEGAVRIGGVDVRDIAPADLHRAVGVLPQRSVLLRTSVRDNIRLAVPDADDATVIAAATAANIHDRILLLEQGYDTVVGDDLTLSSGEKQRIAIARALITDPRILILDEPTSNVDPESAAAIASAISEVVRGRTVVLIAHELDAVVGADHIVVMESGRVAESGTYKELSRRGGLFSQMWQVVSERVPAERGTV